MRIEKLKEEYFVAVRHIAYPLNPDTPDEGLTLEQYFEDDSKEDIMAKKDKWNRAAQEAGLPLSDRNYTYNSRLAQELYKWADSKGKGDEFHKGVFRTYFVEGKNIAKPEVLMDLSESIGLSKNKAKEVIETRIFKDAVDADWSRSLEVDPEVVPSLLVNGNLLENPQQYELVDQFMKENRVKKHNANG